MPTMHCHLLAHVFLVASLHAAESTPPAYDPLRVPDVKISSLTFDVKDGRRDRTLPVRVYLPDSSKPAPVVLFSHGLGGSCDNNPYLGNHWAKRGYVVVFVQHPGSDEGVWKNVPQLRRMEAMKQAASFDNFMLRSGDVPAVIDALTRWNGEVGHGLHGRLDLEKIGMSGHSFGANTTQAVSGQGFARQKVSFVESRLDAAVMMSPGPPALGDPAAAFAPIRIPCLLLTGTRDGSPIGTQKPEDRLKVFPHITQAPAWQVVFKDATHMDFGQRQQVAGGTGASRYHRAILALTTAFWDGQLKNDPRAKSWLNGQGAKAVLDPDDRWEMNPRARQSLP